MMDGHSTAEPETAADAPALAAQLRRAAALDRDGHAEDAIAAYREMIEHWPEGVATHARLGNLLLRLNRPGEALPVLRQALALEPDSAMLQCHLGLACLDLDEPEQAAAAFREALRLRPRFPEALSSLSEALRRLGRLDEARLAAETAVRMDFRRPEAHLHLGNVLGDLGEFAAAANAYRRALGLSPGDAAATSNLGISLYGMGLLAESLAQHRAAVALDPESAGFRYNLAVALLAAGEFEEGWPAYESRLRLGIGQLGFPVRGDIAFDVPGPRWSGEPLAGRTIFLYGEQGLGDTLQFVRYAPVVAERGGRVAIGVPPQLLRLVRRMPCVAEAVPTGGGLPDFDTHCPLLSLPLVLGTTLETIPASTPYLAPDPRDVETWRKRLPRDHRARRVGLVWSGNPRPDMPWAACVDRRRSIPLRHFAPLGGIPGVQYVSLQKGPPAAELDAASPVLPIFDPMDAVEDFADTAALLAHIDLVITVDTSVAHLAGALAKPVWMLSRFDGCWRWLRDRSDSPWYPSMRIYRQPRPGDWDSVIETVAADLRAWAASEVGNG